jgi:ribosomal protein S18 acetylase RimI-like enzyme
VTALDDDTLATLGHLNLIEFSREMARWSGPAGRITEAGGVLCFAASTDFPVLLNGAFRLDRAVPAAEVIARADAFFGELGRGWTLMLRSNHPDDADLHNAALDAGLLTISSSPEMVVRRPVPDVPVPEDVELRWLDGDATLDDFAAVSDAAYASIGMTAGTFREAVTSAEALVAPHIRTVVAYLDGRPVAAAQTLLSHGIAGVYCVGTLEAARGRGLGDLVTRAVTNRAFDEGARANTLQASQMGEPIYARMGWDELYRYTSLVRFTGTP